MAIDLTFLETVGPIFAPELRPLVPMIPKVMKAAKTMEAVNKLLKPHMADITEAIQTFEQVDAIINKPT
jgi:hypothetical protein